MSDSPLRPGDDAPADLPLQAHDDAPDARAYDETAPRDAADGTQQFVVLENSETGETHVAPDSDVSNPHGEGFDTARVHDTPGAAERDAAP